MSEREINILKPYQTGYGLLKEHDAGYIDPSDKRNKERLNEVFSNIGKVDPANYGKTVFPLELYVILQKADIKNQNGRIYPRPILSSQVEAYKELIYNNISGGEIDHPDETTISVERTSHRITEIGWEGNTVVGKILIYVSLGFVNMGIVSSYGDIAALQLSYGHKVGVSSRGVGSVERRNGVDYVLDDFEILCWDIVATPSTPGAWMLNDKSDAKQYLESKEIDKKPLMEDRVKKFLNLLN